MSSTKIDSVNLAYAAVEANNVEDYVMFFTEDSVYKVANFDPVIGHDGIRGLALPLIDMFNSVTHDVKNILEIGDTVVVEMDIPMIVKMEKLPSFLVFMWSIFREIKLRNLRLI